MTNLCLHYKFQTPPVGANQSSSVRVINHSFKYSQLAGILPSTLKMHPMGIILHIYAIIYYLVISPLLLFVCFSMYLGKINCHSLAIYLSVRVYTLLLYISIELLHISQS